MKNILISLRIAPPQQRGVALVATPCHPLPSQNLPSNQAAWLACALSFGSRVRRPLLAEGSVCFQIANIVDVRANDGERKCYGDVI